MKGDVIQSPLSNPEKSLLTEEEQEKLKPKEIKVENPWIYE
jgi:hypothetical protein